MHDGRTIEELIKLVQRINTERRTYPNTAVNLSAPSGTQSSPIPTIFPGKNRARLARGFPVETGAGVLMLPELFAKGQLWRNRRDRNS
jgi:hypothetical protein